MGKLSDRTICYGSGKKGEAWPLGKGNVSKRLLKCPQCGLPYRGTKAGHLRRHRE